MRALTHVVEPILISNLYAYTISIQLVCIMISHILYKLQRSLGFPHGFLTELTVAVYTSPSPAAILRGD
jgi:hypothetical protein